MSSPSLTIERYAEMRAEMETGSLRDEVLARADVTLDAWTAVQRQWLERMSSELERGRLELTNRYTQAFLDRQRALRALKPPAPRPEAAPLPIIEPAAAPPPAPASPVPFTPPALREGQAPPRMLEALTPPSPGATAAILNKPEDVSSTATLPVPSLAQIRATANSPLPFRDAGTTPPTTLAAASPATPAPHAAAKAPELPALVPPSLSHRDADSMAGETVDLTELVGKLRAMKEGGFPFQKTAGQKEPASAGGPAGAPRAPQGNTGSRQEAGPPVALDGTGDISAAVQEALRTRAASPLPFRAGPPLPSSPQSPSEVSPKDARAPAPGARADQTSAAPLVPRSAPPLPFNALTQPQAPAPIQRPTPHQELAPNPPSIDPEHADELPTIYNPPAPGASQTTAPPQVPTLTEYAKLCAELRLDPSQAGAIRARRGLADDATWGAAIRYWQAQLNDPLTREQWAHLMERMMQLAGAGPSR